MPRISHFEIHADDVERAIGFYTTVLGWQFSPWGGPVDYWTITTGPDSEPGINGGLMKRMAPVDGCGFTAFPCTAMVDSLDATVATAVEAGGTVEHPRMPIPGVGWLAYLKDTEGNVFGLMQEDPSAA